MKLKIAIVTKLWEDVSPFSRGGTGSSMGFLVNALVDKGHHVTLFATADSKTKAQKLVSVRDSSYKNDYSEIHEYDNIAEAFRRHQDFDIIHCSVEHKSVFFADLVKTPSLHSIRYGEFFEQELELLKKYRHLNYLGISKSLESLLPFLNWKSFIHNGLDSSLFKQEKEAGDYLLFLARLSPQKGIDTAIKMAKDLNMKLKIAGKKSEVDQDFLKKHVDPYIDNKQIIYLEEVLGDEKVELLSKAKALIQPNRVFEAFGNTFLEALASAVPVVTFDLGAAREVIEHNLTGFVVKTEAEMKKALQNIDKINKEDCFKRANQIFSLDKMASSYEDLYLDIIKENS